MCLSYILNVIEKYEPRMRKKLQCTRTLECVRKKKEFIMLYYLLVNLPVLGEISCYYYKCPSNCKCLNYGFYHNAL